MTTVAPVNLHFEDSGDWYSLPDWAEYFINVGKQVASVDQSGSRIVRLPPLRERQSDIPDIASRLLQQIRHVLRPKTAKASLGLSAEALRFVQTRRWKGNIRQLYNVLLQAAMFATGDEISRGDLEAASIDVGEAPESTGGFTFGSDTPVTEYIENMRKRLFREAIRRSRENQSEAAKLLGVTPAAVSKFVRQQEAAGE